VERSNVSAEHDNKIITLNMFFILYKFRYNRHKIQIVN